MATFLKVRRGFASGLSDQPLIDGTILFAKDTGELFVDASNERYLVNPTIIFSNSTEGWNDQIDLVARKDCFYIYTDYRKQDGKVIPGIKVGDGKAYLIDTPFILDELYDHIEDEQIHVSEDDRRRWNNKVTCYLDSMDNGNLVFSKN